MSVPEGQRGESKFDIFVRTRELACYTIKICCNQTVFLPEYQNAVTNSIIRAATLVFTNVWDANNIRVTTATDKNERRRLQNQAIWCCNRLLALMQIAQRLFHLETKRIKYWGNMTIETRNKIVKWRDSDSKRYKDIK